MARGSTWTPHEEDVLQAARRAGVDYKRIAIVMPHRTPMALRERTRIIREMAGIPARPVMTPERGYSHSMIRRGSDMLLAALQRAKPDLVSNGETA